MEKRMGERRRRELWNQKMIKKKKPFASASSSNIIDYAVDTLFDVREFVRIEPPGEEHFVLATLSRRWSREDVYEARFRKVAKVSDNCLQTDRRYLRCIGAAEQVREQECAREKGGGEYSGLSAKLDRAERATACREEDDRTRETAAAATVRGDDERRRSRWLQRQVLFFLELLTNGTISFFQSRAHAPTHRSSTLCEWKRASRDQDGRCRR